MKLMFDDELEALEKRIREDEQKKLKLEYERLEIRRNELNDHEEGLSGLQQRLIEREMELSERGAKYSRGSQEVVTKQKALKVNEERFNAFVESQKKQIKKTTAFLKKKSEALRTELAKLHDYKNEHDFFKWDCERLSEIATRRLHAYQTNRCLLIAYKAALKEAMTGFSQEQRWHIEAVIEKNLEQAKARYKKRNIEAKKWAEHIKTKETATTDIHEVDMQDEQQTLEALEAVESDGKPKQASEINTLCQS